MTWEALFDQINHAIPSAQITCTVSEPEQAGGLLGKHVTYAIRTEPFGMLVRRRFNDFRWLRDTLTARYVGLFIPSLPETKGLVGSARTSVDSEHVKSRTKLLGIFLERTVRIPLLRTDTTLMAFLTMEDGEWEEAKQTLGRLSIDEERSLGCMSWRSVLEALPPPDQAERKIMDIKLQIDNLRQMFRRVESSVDEMADQLAAYHKSLHSFKESFEEWKVMEQTLSDVFDSRQAASCGDNMGQLMAQYLCTLEGWDLLVGAESDMATDVLHLVIHYEMLQIEAFRAHIKMWDDTSEASSKLEKKLAQLKEERASGQPKRLTLLRHDSKATDDSIAELEAEIAARKAHEGFVQKALVYYEIQRFNQGRTAALKDIISIMSVAQLHYCKTLANLWKGTIQSIPINLDAAVERVRVVLPSIADSMPASQAPATTTTTTTTTTAAVAAVDAIASSPSPLHIGARMMRQMGKVESMEQLERLDEAQDNTEHHAPRMTDLLEAEPYEEEEYDV